jgi:hypothetical protein
MAWDHETVMNASLTAVVKSLERWMRRIARACRWQHDDAGIPGGKRGLSPVI